MNHMLSLYIRTMTSYKEHEKGAVASEYAVLLALIAVAMVTAVTGLGDAIVGRITSAAGVVGN